MSEALNLSDACIKHLQNKIDNGDYHDNDDDKRFDDWNDQDTLKVVTMDIQDFMDFPELRGFTAVAINEDGSAALGTREELEEDEDDD